MATQNYSVYKKLVWRFVRVFIGSFIVTFGAVLKMFDPGELEKVMDGATFFSAVLALAIYPAILAGLIAGVETVGKALREFLAEGDYKHLIHKLPF